MLLLVLLKGSLLFSPPPLPPTFCGIYQYTAYTVYDTSGDGLPSQVPGVGGTLTLRADSTYEKHFSLLMSNGPHYFNQAGRFSIHHDSIRFAFTDLKGHDVQRGTFRYEAANHHLVITIDGYPVGNKGVYELQAQASAIPAKKRLPKR